MPAEMYIKNHEIRKNKVLALLKEAENYFADSDNKEKAAAFSQLYSDIENGNFSVVVVGEFSSGKSTLLNALMGERYLPSYTNETTATINYLKHLDKAPSKHSMYVYYKDPAKAPESCEANFENIKQFTSTSSGINVVNDVDCVELYLNSRFLEKGVSLIDSPGLNGVAEGHRQITEQQIEKSHACIFVFSAEQPGRHTDFSFLHYLRQKMDTILLVLNKIDVIKEKEQTAEDVVNKLKQNYHNQFPNEPIPQIWPIAAYPALVSRSSVKLDYHHKSDHTPDEKAAYLRNSRIEKFEERLWQFLTCGEKTKEELRAPVVRVQKLISEQKRELESQIKRLQSFKDTAELQDNIAAIEDEIEKIRQSMNEKNQEIRKLVKNAINDLRLALESEQTRVHSKYALEIDSWDNTLDLDKTVQNFQRKVVDDYQYSIKRKFHGFFENLLIEAEQTCMVKLDEFEEKFENLQGLNFSVKKELNVNDMMVSFGLEDYNNRIESIQKTIDEIESNIRVAEHEKAKIEVRDYRVESLKREKQALDEKREMILNFPKPSVVIYHEEETIFRDRQGLLGKIGQVLIGKKEEKRSFNKRDTSAIEEFEKENKERLSAINEKEMALIQELKSIDQSSSAQTAGLKLRHLEAEHRKKEEQLKQLREEYKEDFEKRYQQFINKIKSNLRNYLTDIGRDVEEFIEVEIVSKRKSITEIITNVVHTSLLKVLTERQKRMEQIKCQLDSSIEEKNTLTNQYQEELLKIDKIIEQALGLELELEAVEMDTTTLM